MVALGLSLQHLTGLKTAQCNWLDEEAIRTVATENPGSISHNFVYEWARVNVERWGRLVASHCWLLQGGGVRVYEVCRRGRIFA